MKGLLFLFATVLAQNDVNVFTDCVGCLKNIEKKFCKSIDTYKCCSIDDYTSQGCDDKVEGTSCSNTIEKVDGIKSTFVPSSEEEMSYSKYMICP